MKFFTATIIATLAMSLTVQGATKVRMDYDPNASFDHLRTYSWTEHLRSNEVDQALSGSLVSNRIHDAIDTELAGMGYKKVGPAEADFLIAYYLSSEEKTDITTFGGSHYGGCGHSYGRGYGYGYGAYRHNNGFGYGFHSYNPFYYGPGYGYADFGYGAAPIVREHLEVTLTVNIIDPSSNAVIWRGWAIKSLNQSPTPKKVRKFIKRSVHKTLKEFPPDGLEV